MDNQFDNLIKEFNKINFPNPSDKQMTIFDVAGFPHYENVVSNVLQFFLDTNNDKLHGFGNLWLLAIINAYNQKSSSKIPVEEYYTIDVKREYSNGSDKRIDLLVDCESFIIVIENKIYADIYNDLNLYTKMANNYKHTSGGVKGIVLSLFPIKNNDDYLNSANYINITYDDIFAFIENNWSEIDENNKWQLFAKDFTANINQLKGIITMKFDSEWLKFVNENGESVNKLIKLYRDDLDMRLNLLKELDKAFVDFQGIIRHGVYNSTYERYISEYIDVFKDGESTICIETYLMKEFSEKDWEHFNKVYICVWTRKNRNYDFTDVLNRLKVYNGKKKFTQGWGSHYILKEVEINDNFNLQELIDAVINFVSALIQ